MRAIIPVVAAALVFAGCVSQDEPVAESGAEEKTAPTPARAEETTSPSPTAPAPNETAGGAAASDAPTLAAVPFSVEGMLAASWCAPAGPDSCVSAGPRLGDDRSWIEMPTSGTLKRATLTLSWEPSAPTTDELRFAVLRAKSCGDGCASGEAVLEASGASPLVVEGDLPELPPDEWWVVAVRQARITPEPLYGWANLDQRFTVEGTLAVVTPPTR